MQSTQRPKLPKAPRQLTGLPLETCQIPCKRPAIDHFWECQCLGDDGELDEFFVPRRSLPSMPHRPVKMGGDTMVSEPVYAFPVSIDRLVAAALATRRATFLRRLLRPVLERSEIPAARKAAEIFHHDSIVMDEFFRDEIRRQHKLICQVDESWTQKVSSNDSGNEGDKAKADKGVATKAVRRDPYDIRTFREIHAMLHAAYDDAEEGWLLVRNDENVFIDDEIHFHISHCTGMLWHDGHPPNQSVPVHKRVGCRSFDSDYWDTHLKYWWECQKEPFDSGLDWNGSLIEEDIEDLGKSGDGLSDEHIAWYRRLREDMHAQAAMELRNWRDKLIGENGQHSWVQKNVVKVLEEVFRGLKITIINPTVLHENVEGKDRTCNFMPMAWVHLETQWKRLANAPYVDSAGPKNTSGAGNIKCHQGYAPVIPGDPGHWYSNAARDLDQDGKRNPSFEEAAPLVTFHNLFQLPTWLHPLQYLPSGYESAIQGGASRTSKPSKDNTDSNNEKQGGLKNSVTLEGNRIYHHFREIVRLGDTKQWPALVELRKVVHKDGEGEGRYSDDHSSVDWDSHNYSDPKSDGDLDQQENKAYLEEIRQYLDSISHEINPLSDATNSYTWPDDEQENNEHREHCAMLENISLTLRTAASRSDNAGRSGKADPNQCRDLLTELVKFRADYEARRKNLQKGAKHVEMIVKQDVQRAKSTSFDLDRLRRKRYRDLKNVRTRKEALRTERDDLEGQKEVLLAEERRLKGANKRIGLRKTKLKKDKGELEVELEEYQSENNKLRREELWAKREIGKLQAVIQKLKYEKVQTKLGEKKLSLQKRRLDSEKRSKSKGDKSSPSSSNDDDSNENSENSDDSDDSDSEDEDDDEPPKKKQKTTDTGSIDDVKPGKGNGKSKSTDTKENASGTSSPKKQNTGQKDTDGPTVHNPWVNKASSQGTSKKSLGKSSTGKGTAATANTIPKRAAKAAIETNTESTTTTKSPKKPATRKDTKSPSKPAAAAAKPTAKTTKPAASKAAASASRTPTPTSKPQKTIFKQVPTKTTRSSPAPTPTPPATKAKGKPGPKAKTPAKPSAKSSAKAQAKTPAATSRKPAATAAATATASPASVASQPTRTSRRQKNEAAEVEKVSDPEKAAKKAKRNG